MEGAEKMNVSAGRDREDAARYVYENELARTPPMGWNSWNAFRGDIDEAKIKVIADAMVESGLRIFAPFAHIFLRFPQIHNIIAYCCLLNKGYRV
jgi:hypothetical protein